MDIFQMLSLSALLLFYAAYIIKLLLLQSKGIRVDLLGKGFKPLQVRIIEVLLKATTYIGAVVQFATVLLPRRLMVLFTHPIMQIAGIVLAYIGCIFFLMAIWIMKSNWRAGFNKEQHTELVTSGIYRISRNPAFVGFDLLYIGIMLTYPSMLTMVSSTLVLVMFHIQILGEEKHVESAYGAAYMSYASKVKRYLGV